MAYDDPATLGVCAARSQIEAGTLRPAALAEACRARIAARNPEVRAWVHVATDAAPLLAEGLLAFIPFGVKDIIDTVDMPTAYGSPIYDGCRPPRDAGCVALLKEAGAVPVGKTVSTEFAFRHPGPTRNPHHPAHTPGGSSSGSAAAVADRMVPMALGTQTLGSIIRPAAFCGVVGYKPSFGDVTRSGVYDVATSFDTVGCFVRHAEDLPLVRAGLLRAPYAPLARPEPSALGFAVWRDAAYRAATPEARNLVEQVADLLERAGARRHEVQVPDTFHAAKAMHEDIAFYEFVHAAAYERIEQPHLISRTLIEGPISRGRDVTHEGYQGAQATYALLRRQFADLAKAIDVILAPPALGEAPEGIGFTGDPVCNMLWTGLHVPAVTLPAGKGPRGLPLGVQLIGRHHDDARLLAAAETVEALLASAH